MSEADPYTYPGSTVLRNKLGLTHAAQLDRLERRLVTQRAAEGIPAGGFDLAHLRTIHRHLFQDVYDWAGELRTVEIAKGGHQFQLYFDHPRGTPGLFQLMRAKERAAEILGRKTDIMTKRSLHPVLRKRIEASALQIF